MLKLEIDQTQDILSVVEENILLTGPPSLLGGMVSLRNNSAEPLRVKNVPCWLQLEKNKIPSSFPIHFLLAAGQANAYTLNFQLDPQTKPGQYAALVSMGQHEVPVNVLVEENQEIALSPPEITIKRLKPGHSTQARIQLHNLGNVTIVVPEVRRRALFDPYLLSRKLEDALLEKGKEGTLPVLDNFVQTLLGEMGGHLEMKVKEVNQEVAPGESLDLHLSITAAKEPFPVDKLEMKFEILNKSLKVLVSKELTTPSISANKSKKPKSQEP